MFHERLNALLNFFTYVVEHSFVYFLCLNSFCLKLTNISQLPKQVRLVDLLSIHDIQLILDFKATKLGWLVAWTFDPKRPQWRNPEDSNVGYMEAKWSKSSNLPNLLHKRLWGLGSVYVAEHNFFGIHSYPKAMQTPIMVGHGPEKSYVHPDIDLEIP